jgi:hypothetical protein
MIATLVITIAGVDVIGDLDLEDNQPPDTGWAKVWHPYLLQMQQQNNLCLRPMLKGSSIISGDLTRINMRLVTWINEPSHLLLKTYQAARMGLVVAQSELPAVNQ